MEYKKLLSVIEKKFSLDKTSEANLYISLDYQHIKVAAIYENKLQMLEHLYYYQPINTEEWENKLENIKNSSDILVKRDWKSVTILPPFKAFTLVPKDLFVPAHALKYLQHADNKAAQNPIVANEQKNFDAINIFNVPYLIYEWGKKNYTKVNFKHITEIFLNQLKNKNTTKESQIHILVNEKYLVITVLNNAEVLFCNAFEYKTSRDFLYYVLFVIDELRIDKSKTSVKLYGQINQVAEIYRLLNNYVSELSLWEGNLTIEMSENFVNITKLHYFDVWGMTL